MIFCVLFKLLHSFNNIINFILEVKSNKMLNFLHFCLKIVKNDSIQFNLDISNKLFFYSLIERLLKISLSKKNFALGLNTIKLTSIKRHIAGTL